jgi:hypothetical protein
VCMCGCVRFVPVPGAAKTDEAAGSCVVCCVCCGMDRWPCLCVCVCVCESSEKETNIQKCAGRVEMKKDIRGERKRHKHRHTHMSILPLV